MSSESKGQVFIISTTHCVVCLWNQSLTAVLSKPTSYCVVLSSNNLVTGLCVCQSPAVLCFCQMNHLLFCVCRTDVWLAGSWLLMFDKCELLLTYYFEVKGKRIVDILIFNLYFCLFYHQYLVERSRQSVVSCLSTLNDTCDIFYLKPLQKQNSSLSWLYNSDVTLPVQERLRAASAAADSLLHDPFASQDSEGEVEVARDKGEKIEFSYASYMRELHREELLNNIDESIFSSLTDSGEYLQMICSWEQ